MLFLNRFWLAFIFLVLVTWPLWLPGPPAKARWAGEALWLVMWITVAGALIAISRARS